LIIILNRIIFKIPDKNAGSSSMRYFVTGGTGLIGAYVTRQLVDAGNHVTVYDLSPDMEFLRDLLVPEQLEQVRVVSGDVTDLPALLRSIKSSDAQRIIHLAALLGSKSNDNPLLSLKVNCEGTLNIFEAALDRSVERVVWASSVGVFGIANKRSPGPVKNEALHQPTDLYGACKSLNERFSKHYRRAYGLDCIGLRYAAVYGYGKARTLARGTGAAFMTELIDKPAAGLPGLVPAGDAIIDFIHVEDAARATVLAAHAARCKPVALNIGGFRTTLRDAAGIVMAAVPEAHITVEAGSWNGIDHNYDLSEADAAIGYRPQITLDEGLRENIAQIRRRLQPSTGVPD
jgi:nucleoside-diphosphate-sugar epimerase